MTQPPEFSRPVRIESLGAAPHAIAVAADEAERRALARRFGLVAIDALSADVALTRSGDEIRATGTLAARVTQSCVATAAPVAAELNEFFAIAFRPQPAMPAREDEIELSDAELDVVFYDGGSIDIGETVAETLSLGLDPWPRAPGADAVLRAAGVKDESEAGPFSALRDLLKP